MVEVRKFSAPMVSLKRCMSPGDSLGPAGRNHLDRAAGNALALMALLFF
jgi:hypothetical protein